MTSLTLAASWLVAGAGVVIAVAAGVATRRLLAGLPVLLDLMLAAGLLRLSTATGWQSILTAAVIVVIRKLVTAGLRQDRSAANAA